MKPSALPQDIQNLVGDAQSDRDAQRAIEDATAAMRAQLEAGIGLAGRTFLPIRVVTFDLQQRRVQLIERAAIMPLFPSFDTIAGDPDVLSGRVLQAAFASGALYDLLAHLLVDQGADYLPWSVPDAAERALFFATLVRPEDHQRLTENVLWLVLDFFLSASASSPIFAKSLAALARPAADRRARDPQEVPQMELDPATDSGSNRPPNTSAAEDSSSSAEISTSDAGTASSGRSRDFEASIP